MSGALEISLIMLSSGIGAYLAFRGMAYILYPPKEYFVKKQERMNNK